MRRSRFVGWLLSRGILALFLLVGTTAAARAQTDPEELRRELAKEKARLEEQIKRIDELEKRMEAALAESESSPEVAATESAASPDEGAEGDKGKDEGAESKDIVPERLQTGPNQTRDPHEVMTGAELVASDFPGSWPLFGTDYRMKFGGYFKLDALYDFDGDGDKYQFLISEIPVANSPEAESAGYFNMFVRETRFNFDVRNSSSAGTPQQFFLEMDFFDESSLSPRLRHAYLVYGNLLVGQTWTTVAELASLTFTIDFGAGDALFGTRTPQIRWQQQVSPSWNWALGLEMLESSGIYNPLDLQGDASPQLPVLAGRVTHQRTNGLRTVAALVQQLHWDSESSAPGATAMGWALIFAGRQNLNRRDFFTYNLAYGDGTAENIMALTGSDANAVLTAEGKLVTREGYSAALGLGHKFSETLSSNLSYAWTDLQDLGPGNRPPDAIQSGGIGHLNLIWARNKLSTGIEFMWGNRQNADGDKGEATRVQTMIKYQF